MNFLKSTCAFRSLVNGLGSLVVLGLVLSGNVQVADEATPVAVAEIALVSLAQQLELVGTAVPERVSRISAQVDPNSILETSITAVAVAAAGVKQRQANVAEPKALVARHQVVAPFAGIVNRKLTEVGQSCIEA